METESLTKRIIGCAFAVHNALGAGFMKKVYENALAIEIGEAGLRVQQQAPIAVYYRDRVVGEYVADLVVEGAVIVEVKAVQTLAMEHEVQLVNYLAATKIEDGLLINFGSSVQVKHKYHIFRARGEKKRQD